MINEGVCSSETETLLRTKDCGFLIREQRTIIFDTIEQLLRRMCKLGIVDNLFSSFSTVASTRQSRLVPLEFVIEYPNETLSTKLDFGRFFLSEHQNFDTYMYCYRKHP